MVKCTLAKNSIACTATVTDTSTGIGLTPMELLLGQLTERQHFEGVHTVRQELLTNVTTTYSPGRGEPGTITIMGTSR